MKTRKLAKALARLSKPSTPEKREPYRKPDRRTQALPADHAYHVTEREFAALESPGESHPMAVLAGLRSRGLLAYHTEPGIDGLQHTRWELTEFGRRVLAFHRR